MAGRGGAIPGSGRKRKEDEKRIMDIVSPYVPGAIETIVNIMNTAKRDADRVSAAKLLLSYAWGMPPQFVGLSGDDGQGIEIIVHEKRS